MVYSLYLKLGHEAPCKEMLTALYYQKSSGITQKACREFQMIWEGKDKLRKPMKEGKKKCSVLEV